MRSSSLLYKITAALFILLGFLTISGLPASAQESQPSKDAKEGLAIVAKIDGLIDGIMADFIEESIQTAEKENALVLVLQVNSSNVVVSPERFEELTSAIQNANIDVASWVGPSGAQASGQVADLVRNTQPIGIAPGAHIDYEGVGDEGKIGFQEAPSVGALATPTIGDLLVNLDGFETREVQDDEDCTQDCLVHLEPVSRVRFTRLSFLDQALHTVASPPIAYLLFGFGLALIVLEYYTAGIGISGVIGAVSFLLGVYGLVVLPTNLWAVVLLVVGIFGYGIDVQTGVPRLWTIISTGAYLAGSLFLFRSGIELSWILLLVGVGGMILGMVGALPVLVRSRFTTPNIGKDWLAEAKKHP